MSPQETLNRHSDVVVVNSTKFAIELGAKYRALSEAEQRQHFGGDHKVGFFYLYRHPSIPGVVMECVVSPAGDSVTATYMDHQIFATVGELMKSRDYLQRALAQKIGISRESAGVQDAGRGRYLGLSELSTGQLIDLLADRMGVTIGQADNVSLAGTGGVGIPS